jgi:hypothetical protein
MCTKQRTGCSSGAATFAAALLLLTPGLAGATPVGGLVISEILFDPAGNDNTTEWVELYNRSAAPIDLAAYSLGWGRDAYDDGTHVLPSFLLAPGATFVIGGPTSNAANGNPVYGEAFNFAPNLLQGTNNNWADTVALFLGDIGSNPTLTPVHAVIYGESTASTTLLDEQGVLASILFDTDGFAQGTSIEWLGGNGWGAAAGLGPNVAPTPEPGTAILVGLGLIGLGVSGRTRHARR